MTHNESTDHSSTARPRLTRVDAMMGLAVIWVVLGHQSFPFAPEWYSHGLHEWIYSFHMELFVFLSGVVVRYSYRGVRTAGEYARYEWRKLRKFLPPYLLVGLAVAVVAAGGVPREGAGLWLWQQLRLLLLYPMYCDASFLWYVYLLMLYYLLAPLLFAFPEWVRWLLLVPAFALSLFSPGYLLCGTQLCQYSGFFLLGVVCADAVDLVRRAHWTTWLFLSLPFFFSIVAMFSPGDLPKGILPGLYSLPASYLAAIGIERWRPAQRLMERIARGCYWVYLLQMFFVWGGAMLYQHVSTRLTLPFARFMIGNTLLGLAGPLLLQHIVERLAQRHRRKADGSTLDETDEKKERKKGRLPTSLK